MRIRPVVINEPRPADGTVSTPRADALLAWYDRAARRLPWRAPPGEPPPEPYRVWLSEVMLQQTTVAAAVGHFERFTARWPTVAALAAAADAEVMAAWAGLGYYARARNLLACARAVAARGGRFPDDEAGLRVLPGVGPYTAAAVAAIAFGRRATPVDGNVERVMARLHAVETPLPAAKRALAALAAGLTPDARTGDYAQAVMDLGATVCTPRRPACALCPWAGACLARRRGIAGDLPRRAAKPVRPERFGIAYVALRPDGAVLVETRPARGLLGGMLGLPGSGWTETPPAPQPPAPAAWRDAGVEVRHVFTHFRLTLRVEVARLDPGAVHAGDWRAAGPALEAALPTVMRKALRAGLAAAAARGRPALTKLSIE
jgi:A/G-specific adenine glycosylase